MNHVGDRSLTGSKSFQGPQGARPGWGELAWLTARPGLTAFTIVLIGILATLWAWRTVDVREQRLIAERFENLADRFISDVERHKGAHDQSLRAGAALLTIVGDVNAARWRAIYDNLRVSEKLPGVQGYGFARAVRPQGLLEHVESVRAEGFADYGVTPEGMRALYTPIVYIEPFDWRNQRAHGYDMFSDPERRQAMIRAAASGMTVATARVQLVQETGVDEQVGFLLYSPVYSGGAASGAVEPFPALAGFVYSPVRVTDFLNPIFTAFDAYFEQVAAIEVFDGAEATPEALMYQSAGVGEADRSRAIVRAHDVFGQTWTMRIAPRPAFAATVDQRSRLPILVGGATMSMMAGALALALAQRQRQRELGAERNDMIAREMSHRVKNLLAVIQSIASRTLTDGRTLQEARSVFSDRIAALARAHSALVDGRWSGAHLRDLLEGELAPFGERVAMVGPRMHVNSQAAQNLAMAVHELATNATKYGALSAAEGIVRIRWRVLRGDNGDQLFSFSWEESGGPPPPVDAKDGFGRVLLRRLIGSTIGAEPSIEHLPGGLRYAFECPLARIGELAVEAPARGRKR